MNLPNRILCLDLETTGLNSTYDYIVQIGAVEMLDDEIVDMFRSRIQPNVAKLSIKGDALAAQCGDLATDEGANRAAQWLKGMYEWPLARDVAFAFAEWSKDRACLPVVAHNATFDMAFLSQWMYQQRTQFKAAAHFGITTICTMQLAKLAWPGGGSYSLDTCLTLAGVNARPKDHDALQDAILAGRLYFRMKEKLEAGQEVPGASLGELGRGLRVR